MRNLYYLYNVILIFHRRNCKANPNCFNCLGERFWLGEIKGKSYLANKPKRFMKESNESKSSISMNHWSFKTDRHLYLIYIRVVLSKAKAPFISAGPSLNSKLFSQP